MAMLITADGPTIILDRFFLSTHNTYYLLIITHTIRIPVLYVKAATIPYYTPVEYILTFNFGRVLRSSLCIEKIVERKIIN